MADASDASLFFLQLELNVLPSLPREQGTSSNSELYYHRGPVVRPSVNRKEGRDPRHHENHTVVHTIYDKKNPVLSWFS